MKDKIYRILLDNILSAFPRLKVFEASARALYKAHKERLADTWSEDSPLLISSVEDGYDAVMESAHARVMDARDALYLLREFVEAGWPADAGSLPAETKEQAAKYFETIKRINELERKRNELKGGVGGEGGYLKDAFKKRYNEVGARPGAGRKPGRVVTDRLQFNVTPEIRKLFEELTEREGLSQVKFLQKILLAYRDSLRDKGELE